VGDLRIDDDGDEVTISVGQLTDGHFVARAYDRPAHEREDQVIDRVLEFLNEVFQPDRVLDCWKMGRLDSRKGEPLAPGPNMGRLVWSGSVTPAPPVKTR
jgi:hypothetical protein